MEYFKVNTSIPMVETYVVTLLNVQLESVAHG
jgi:hypothetical protein